MHWTYTGLGEEYNTIRNKYLLRLFLYTLGTMIIVPILTITQPIRRIQFLKKGAERRRRREGRRRR